MKKTTLLLLLLWATNIMAQQKSTGMVNFLPNLSASLVLDNSSQTATMTIDGPSDRWFAITFGNFNKPGAMSNGNDVVYFNGTTLVDARHNGQGIEPSPDATNNWTVTDNTVDGDVRTLIATRPFSGDANDFQFNYADPSIKLAGAHADSPIMATLQYHGGNRNNFGTALFTALGVEDFSLNSAIISPNPAKGHFSIKTKSALHRVNIYTHTGAFVKTIEAKPGEMELVVNVEGLQAGVYMIELQNNSEKSWKKIIVE